MPESHSYKFVVSVNDAALSDETDLLLRKVVIEDNLNLPDLFVLTFHDPERTVLQRTGIAIGSKVEIAVISDESTSGDTLVTGEVTALEAEYHEGGTHYVARGLDFSHRLFRGRTTETYVQSSASDIAAKVARRAGLAVGQIDPSTTVHPHVSQANLNDWEFLQRLAQEIGYQVTVPGGKFEFRAPPSSASAPPVGEGFDTANPLQLKLGEELIRFQAVVTSAEQVKEVQVRGWDPTQKRAVVATASAQTATSSVSAQPADLAASFGSPTHVSVDTPFATQTEVDAAAKAIAEQIAGASAEFEGMAWGNPKLRAGLAISVGLVGDPFEGKYTLTTTRHVYEPGEGYVTHVSATGRQERSLLGLMSPNGLSGSKRIPGVVVAQVSNVNDPDELGRVKLKFPWLSDTYESDWSRTAHPGAGKDRGQVILPEVNDEVLVAFEHGDTRRPYVIGGLYNGLDKPKLGNGLIDGSTGAVKRRGFISKKGGMLVFLDDDGKEGIALLTGDKGLKISLNKSKTTIKITSNGQVQIEGSQDVSIKSGTKLSIEATSSLSLKAPEVTIDGDSKISINGKGPVEVKSSANTTVEGSMLSLKGSATAELNGGGMCQIQGGLVKIN